MTITYVSTITERFVMEDNRPSDGARRVCIGTRVDDGGNRTLGGDRWKIELVHPSGYREELTTYANRAEVKMEMVGLMETNRRRFLEEGAHGDRRESEQIGNYVALP